MHTTVPRPRPKSLTIEVKDNATCTPQENQRHVQHNRRHIASTDDPWRDELAETVAPHVLVDCDGHEDAARNGLVAVDAVCGRDGGYGGDLDASACVPDYHDGLREVLVVRR